MLGAIGSFHDAPMAARRLIGMEVAPAGEERGCRVVRSQEELEELVEDLRRRVEKLEALLNASDPDAAFHDQRHEERLRRLEGSNRFTASREGDV